MPVHLSDNPTACDQSLTTDFRSVLGEVIEGHVGAKNLAQVFPGFDNSPQKFPKLLKA